MQVAKPNQEQEEAIKLLIDWYNDKQAGRELATLKGYAGTGKTFTTNHFIQALNLLKSQVLVAAPTNKAVKVISNMTGMKGKTIHSILGLQPNMDLSTFTPLTMKFVRKNDGDMNYKLIIIDEASMINKSLYAELKARAEDAGIKILFTGDPLQLLPVKETKISSVFTDPVYQASLNNIVRQGKDNPNTDLIRLAADDVLNGTDKLDDFILRNSQTFLPEDLLTTKGFIYMSNTSLKTIDFLRADRDNLYTGESKYMAYTNKSVMGTVTGIRKSVFNLEEYITVGEQLMGYRVVTIKKGKISTNVIANSEDYEIVDVNPITIREGIQGFAVTLQNYITKSVVYVNIVDAKDTASFARYQEILFELYFNAKKLGRSAWVKYYDFINSILCFEDISTEIAGKEEKIKSKDLYYNSGITVHKSQGSTYKNSFVNLTNLNRCYDYNDRRRLKYVSFSRTENVNVIF